MAAPAVSGPESVDAYGTNDDSITGLVDGSGVTVIPLSELIDSRPPDWEAVWRRPKDDFGDFHFRAGWYKTLRYHLLHTGGFLRLCTDRGRLYWLRQNENGHTTPDWKLHISVELPYVTAAWKLMSALFIDMHGDFGIKATCQADPTLWGSQRGREITVYMFVYDPKYPIGECGVNKHYSIVLIVILLPQRKTRPSRWTPFTSVCTTGHSGDTSLLRRRRF